MVSTNSRGLRWAVLPLNLFCKVPIGTLQRPLGSVHEAGSTRQGSLDRGPGRLGVGVVLAAFAGPERGHVGPVHAAVRAIAAGVTGADVDEHPHAPRALEDGAAAD